MSDLEATVRTAVELLVRGEPENLEEMTRGKRLSAAQLAQAISEYGRTLVPPPLEWWKAVEVTPITNSPGMFHVAAPMWTAEEGRSDLTLELWVQASDGGLEIEAVLDLHVL
jgi:hypothetical protein